MSLKTKLILWPTLIAVATVFIGYRVIVSDKDPRVVRMSVTSGAPQHKFAVIYEVIGKREPMPTAKGDWSRTLPAKRGDVILVVAEQQMDALLTCVIKVNGDGVSAGTIDWAGRVSCTTTVL